MRMLRKKFVILVLLLASVSLETPASCLTLYSEQQASGWTKLLQMLDRTHQYRDPYYWPYRILVDAYLLAHYPQGTVIHRTEVGQTLSSFAERLPASMQRLDHLTRVIIKADRENKFCEKTLASESTFLTILIQHDPSWAKSAILSKKHGELKSPVEW